MSPLADMVGWHHGNSMQIDKIRHLDIISAIFAQIAFTTTFSVYILRWGCCTFIKVPNAFVVDNMFFCNPFYSSKMGGHVLTVASGKANEFLMGRFLKM